MAGSADPPELSSRDRAVLYVDLRHYFERLLLEHAKLHASDQQALSVALDSMNQRLATMNEFRGSLEDMTRQMVKRDMFDIVTDRLGVVENTYVKGKDYQADQRRQAEQDAKDFEERDRRLRYLESNAATTDALAAQRQEAERSRKTLTYALVGVGLAAALNFLINVYQGARGH